MQDSPTIVEFGEGQIYVALSKVRHLSLGCCISAILLQCQ